MLVTNAVARKGVRCGRLQAVSVQLGHLLYFSSPVVLTCSAGKRKKTPGPFREPGRRTETPPARLSPAAEVARQGPDGHQEAARRQRLGYDVVAVGAARRVRHQDMEGRCGIVQVRQTVVDVGRDEALIVDRVRIGHAASRLDKEVARRRVFRREEAPVHAERLIIGGHEPQAEDVGWHPVVAARDFLKCRRLVILERRSRKGGKVVLSQAGRGLEYNVGDGLHELPAGVRHIEVVRVLPREAGLAEVLVGHSPGERDGEARPRQPLHDEAVRRISRRYVAQGVVGTRVRDGLYARRRQKKGAEHNDRQERPS